MEREAQTAFFTKGADFGIGTNVASGCRIDARDVSLMESRIRRTVYSISV